jgi:hypothetical protein
VSEVGSSSFLDINVSQATDSRTSSGEQLILVVVSLIVRLASLVAPHITKPVSAIAKQASDYPASISSSSTINYNEGLNVDYRWFDAQNITPRYEFG